MRLPRRYAYLMSGEPFSNLGSALSSSIGLTLSVFSVIVLL